MITIRYISFVIIIFLGCIAAFAVGLRGPTDPDYSAYIDIISNVKTFSVEPIFYFFAKLINDLNFDYVIYFLFVSLLSVLIKIYVFYEHFPYPIFTTIMYFASWYLVYDAIAIRQGLAMAFVLWAFFLKNRSHYLVASLAIMSHYSAIVPVLFIYFGQDLIRGSFTKQSLIFLGTLLIGYSNSTLYLVSLLDNLSIFGEISTIAKILYYSDIQQFSFPTKAFVVFMLARYFFDHHERCQESVVNVYFVGLIVANLFCFLPEFSFRIRSYFFVFEPYLYAIVARGVVRKFRSHSMLVYAILAILMALQAYSAYSFWFSLYKRNMPITFFGNS